MNSPLTQRRGSGDTIHHSPFTVHLISTRNVIGIHRRSSALSVLAGGFSFPQAALAIGIALFLFVFLRLLAPAGLYNWLAVLLVSPLSIAAALAAVRAAAFRAAGRIVMAVPCIGTPASTQAALNACTSAFTSG